MKFLNYMDKVWVLKATRAKGKILVNSKHVSFFPDFSTDMLKCFNSAEKKLLSLY